MFFVAKWVNGLPISACVFALFALGSCSGNSDNQTADGFFLDGSTLPPDSNPADDKVKNGIFNRTGDVGDFDWMQTEGATQGVEPLNQDEVNVLDARVVNDSDYPPLGPGNSGIFMTAGGPTSATNTESLAGTRNEFEYKLGRNNTAMTLAARFRVVYSNNARPSGDAPEAMSGILALVSSSGPGIVLGLTSDPGAGDHVYYYSLAQFRPKNATDFVVRKPAFAPLDSGPSQPNKNQAANGWVDVWLYSDNQGQVQMRFLDEATNKVIEYSAHLPSFPNFGSAFFGAGLREVPIPGNGDLKVVFDAVRLTPGNTVGKDFIPAGTPK